MIVGLDEVGRGCWAGPLCVAAVTLTRPVAGLRDSKLLSAAQRERLCLQIRQNARVGIAWIPAPVLDKLGLTKALEHAMRQAIGQLETYDEVIIDGTYNFLKDFERPVRVMPKADQFIPEVSAASIIAKVARDTYMSRMHLLYPAYGFQKHVGYGTARHLSAMQEHGITTLHRKSFKPVRIFIEQTQ